MRSECPTSNVIQQWNRAGGLHALFHLHQHSAEVKLIFGSWEERDKRNGSEATYRHAAHKRIAGSLCVKWKRSFDAMMCYLRDEPLFPTMLLCMKPDRILLQSVKLQAEWWHQRRTEKEEQTYIIVMFVKKYTTENSIFLSFHESPKESQPPLPLIRKNKIQFIQCDVKLGTAGVLKSPWGWRGLVIKIHNQTLRYKLYCKWPLGGYLGL